VTGPSIGTVYLARQADGLAALDRFASSYRLHPAGIAHDLIVVYKGFARPISLQTARAVFQDIPHIGIELADVGFDIGSYLETSRRVSHDYLLFLNTHSEIVAHGWLASLAGQALRKGVGIVGAMGSYESIQDTAELLKTVIWSCIGLGRSYDEKIAFYFDFVLRQHHPGWYAPSGLVVPPTARKRGLLANLAITIARVMRYPWFVSNGTALIWPGAQPFDIKQFPRFPNPHIRSNGFMLRRDLLLSLRVSPTATKIDANLFESGALSLTQKLRRTGLSAIVVGKDGRGYDVPDWWRSGTFRLGDQGNLLIADNHTRAFAVMSDGARVAHARMTWGDYLGPAPQDFPDFGFGFEKAPSLLAAN